jgi:hypothetical protein
MKMDGKEPRYRNKISEKEKMNPYIKIIRK